jgi:hypothetical protein
VSNPSTKYGANFMRKAMSNVGDCDFFGWADNKMSTYEKKKKLMEHLKDPE